MPGLKLRADMTRWASATSYEVVSRCGLLIESEPASVEAFSDLRQERNP